MAAPSARKFFLQSLAASRRSDTSTPASALGTKPKALSALNLPPTCGSALITDSPCARASRSKGESGSVTTTMCSAIAKPALVKAEAKAARADEVSIVEPDLDETTTKVDAKSPLIAWAR